LEEKKKGSLIPLHMEGKDQGCMPVKSSGDHSRGEEERKKEKGGFSHEEREERCLAVDGKRDKKVGGKEEEK